MRFRRSYGKHPTFYLDDREVTEAEYMKAEAELPDKFAQLVESGELLYSQSTTLWPLRSEALAVSPRQVEAANARNARHGIATRYDARTGQAVIPSAADRAKLIALEARTALPGLVDKT